MRGHTVTITFERNENEPWIFKDKRNFTELLEARHLFWGAFWREPFLQLFESTAVWEGTILQKSVRVRSWTAQLNFDVNNHFIINTAKKFN